MLVSVNVLKITKLVNGLLCYVSHVDCIVFGLCSVFSVVVLRGVWGFFGVFCVCVFIWF